MTKGDGTSLSGKKSASSGSPLWGTVTGPVRRSHRYINGDTNLWELQTPLLSSPIPNSCVFQGNQGGTEGGQGAKAPPGRRSAVVLGSL